ncbi:hypothetical protein Glove_74g92 [Diversispora epigaea]|uniref:Uncharacterized protein n=1 Tax=Diversispora epigaea TaxID=1348612 RepID=A0A397JJ38_9GLOM|nr:hypothetical protein Glove_74g92 [Diversispora epigaea]
MVEYYKNDTWEAINNTFQSPQAIWLMGVGDGNQTISQFVLEDGCTFRTWKKYIEIIESSCIEHGHGERWNAPNYHISDVICIYMKEYYPASIRDQEECTLWFNRFGHPTYHLVKVVVNGKLPQEDITGFAQL